MRVELEKMKKYNHDPKLANPNTEFIGIPNSSEYQTADLWDSEYIQRNVIKVQFIFTIKLELAIFNQTLKCYFEISLSKTTIVFGDKQAKRDTHWIFLFIIFVLNRPMQAGTNTNQNGALFYLKSAKNQSHFLFYTTGGILKTDQHFCLSCESKN